MNGKFVEKYGNTWAELNPDMKMMAIMSEIFDLREDISPMKDACKTVDKHKTYFKAVGLFVTCILFPVLVYLIIRSLGG